MDYRTQLYFPPRMTSWSGAIRNVGVELEFAAISARDGARLVRSLFGGSIAREDPHRFHVTGTEFGSFTCELDTQYAHRAQGERDEISQADDLFARFIADFRDQIREVYGNISSLVVPCEIVCPPIPLEQLQRLDTLVQALIEAGAEGTRTSPFYAFGAQLNPEIATKDSSWLTAILKAYLLSSDWLRAVMDIDPTRRLVSFADPFPAHYVAQVVDPDYWPKLAALMDDYLIANPTRNRELDLLPLFAWIDRARVDRSIADPRVKARPTFHYRLPDANFGVSGWNLTLEWNRWWVVEQLAEQRDALGEMGQAYLENASRLVPGNWAIQSSEWLVLSRPTDAGR